MVAGIGGILPLDATAQACVLDNTSSLSANGIAALKNVDAPSGNLASWAPFVFERAYGQGGAIHFAEKMSDLQRSLSLTALHHAFLWKWGDGRQTIGQAGSHAYTGLGTYVVSVYGYDRARGWFPFDRATLRIVPDGEVWRDNLGWEFLDILSFVLIWGFRIVVTVVSVALAYGFWADWRHRHGRRSKGAR